MLCTKAVVPAIPRVGARFADTRGNILTIKYSAGSVKRLVGSSPFYLIDTYDMYRGGSPTVDPAQWSESILPLTLQRWPSVYWAPSITLET